MDAKLMKTHRILLMLSILTAIFVNHHSCAQQHGNADDLVTFQVGQTLAKLRQVQFSKRLRISAAMLMAMKMKATNDVIIVLERGEKLYLLEYLKRERAYGQLTVWQGDKYFSLSTMDELKPLGLPIVGIEEAQRNLFEMEEKKTGKKVVPNESP